VSALCYFRIEQFFRSGDLNAGYKKARFHIMFIVRLISMGDKLEFFNSNKMDKNCEKFKLELLDEPKALKLFKTAEKIFETSGLDMEKKQYKSESETDLLVASYITHSRATETA
jgi:hypothetical protein